MDTHRNGGGMGGMEEAAAAMQGQVATTVMQLSVRVDMLTFMTATIINNVVSPKNLEEASKTKRAMLDTWHDAKITECQERTGAVRAEQARQGVPMTGVEELAGPYIGLLRTIYADAEKIFRLGPRPEPELDEESNGE